MFFLCKDRYDYCRIYAPPVGQGFTMHQQNTGLPALGITAEISSAANPRYKLWRKLLEAKGIKKHQQALVAGKKILREIALLYPERMQALLICSPIMLEELPLPPALPVYLLTPALFAQLDIYGTKAPLLLIDALPLPLWTGTLAEGVTLFLPFQNPINLGTTIRTAAACGATVVLLQEAASPYLPKSLRAAGPAMFQTPVLQGPSLYELASANIPHVYALDLEGTNIFQFTFPQTIGLVAGMEGPGVGAQWASTSLLRIPMQEQVESLNAAVAVSMALACYLGKCSA